MCFFFLKKKMNSNSDITITPIKPMVYNDYNTLKTELIKLAKELVSKLDNPSPDTIIKICKNSKIIR